MTFHKDPQQNETKHLLQFANFPGKRVLEIGCGEGRLTWRYAAKPAMTVGIDPDRDALRVATIDRPSDLDGPGPLLECAGGVAALPKRDVRSCRARLVLLMNSA